MGLSFVSFIEIAHYQAYGSLGAISSGAGNPMSWRTEDAPSLSEGVPAQLILTAVMLVGFGFLGGVAFFNALLTMFRFDKLHPQHHGAIKDFIMYLFGGLICTSLPTVFGALATYVTFLKGTAEMLKQASDIL